MHAFMPISSATTYLPLNKSWETLSEVQVSETEILTLPDPELFIILNDVPTKIQVVGPTLVDVMAIRKLQEIS